MSVDFPNGNTVWRFIESFDIPIPALVSHPDIDETMMVAVASVDKRACTQVSPQENSQQLQVTIPRKHFFIQLDTRCTTAIMRQGINWRNHLVSFRLKSWN
jgi:hypothetical protein